MISLEEFSEIRVGDMVKIVDKWDENTDQNWDGYMDKYLGNVYQVSNRGHDYLQLLLPAPEGEQIWSWNRYCIAEVIYQDVNYNGDFSSLI